MRVITKGKEPHVLLWNGSVIKNVEYRLLRYHVRTECEKGELLLNTVTGELILLNKTEKDLLDNLPALYTPEMDDLITHRFLVPESFDDLRSVDQLRKLIRMLNVCKDITSYSILPTTACNARCFYCFENKDPHHTMTPEIVDKVVRFITEHCGEEKKVGIKWFGGEPTLGEHQIDQICDGLQENGICYTSSAISNAYLFTEDMVNKAKEKWKLKSIQITLDGTEQVYNETKAYINAHTSPYQRVMKNIRLLLDQGIQVSLRMNLGWHNMDDLAALIGELSAKFSKDRCFSAYVAPLFEDEGVEYDSHSVDGRQRLNEAVYRLNSLIDTLGCKRSSEFSVNSELPSLKIYYCMADNPSSMQINPLGEFGKCEHEIFDKLVGNLYTGIEEDNQPHSLYWLRPVYLYTCKECSLYPACGRIESCKAGNKCMSEHIKEKLEDVKKQIQYRYKKQLSTT